MSTITWDRINNDVENIINEFNNFLDNNQYNEANEIIEDIMSAFCRHICTICIITYNFLLTILVNFTSFTFFHS